MNKDKKHQEEIPHDEEVEIIDTIGEDESAEQVEEAELAQIDELCKQLAEEKVKVEKEKKEYLFLMAEFDNFRKRTLKEKSELVKNAAESVLKGLLPIVDDFERGLQATQNSDDANAVREGMELIYSKLVKYLEQNGVKAMESTGAVFDPEHHEAVAMVPAASEDMKGKVIDTVTKGYTLNGDKVIRFAKVAVGE